MLNKKILVPISDIMLITPSTYEELFKERPVTRRELGLILIMSFKKATEALESVLFEDPAHYTSCVVITTFKKMPFKHAVVVIVSLEQPFYDKHLGKLIDEARQKELSRIIDALVKSMSTVDWIKLITEAKGI